MQISLSAWGSDINRTESTHTNIYIFNTFIETFKHIWTILVFHNCACNLQLCQNFVCLTFPFKGWSLGLKLKAIFCSFCSFAHKCALNIHLLKNVSIIQPITRLGHRNQKGFKLSDSVTWPQQEEVQRHARSQGGAGATHHPKSAKRSIFCHKVG